MSLFNHEFNASTRVLALSSTLTNQVLRRFFLLALSFLFGNYLITKSPGAYHHRK